MPEPNEPNASTFDSGHPIPVLHAGTGEIHKVDVPPGTDFADLHAAFGDAGYHSAPDVSALTGQKPPTAARAIENSPEFRASSRSMWQAVGEGRNPTQESGFSVYNDGGTSNIHTETHPQGTGIADAQRDRISYQKGDFGVNHSHPSSANSSDQPSARMTSRPPRKQV